MPTFTFIDEAWVAIHRVTSLSRSDAALSTGVHTCRGLSTGSPFWVVLSVR